MTVRVAQPSLASPPVVYLLWNSPGAAGDWRLLLLVLSAGLLQER